MLTVCIDRTDSYAVTSCVPAEVVRMELGAGQQLIFGGFKAFDMDNFLALAWHFTSDTT